MIDFAYLPKPSTLLRVCIYTHLCTRKRTYTRTCTHATHHMTNPVGGVCLPEYYKSSEGCYPCDASERGLSQHSVITITVATIMLISAFIIAIAFHTRLYDWYLARYMVSGRWEQPREVMLIRLISCYLRSPSHVP